MKPHSALFGFVAAFLMLGPTTAADGPPATPTSVTDGSEFICSNPPKYLILLRHACKKYDPSTPDKCIPLCASGERQAQELVGRLKDYNISDIYVTTAERSSQTVKRLVDTSGPPTVHIIEYSAPAAAKLVTDICSNPQSTGKTLLHIGHSSTLGNAFAALRLPKPTYYKYAEGWVISFPDGHPKPQDFQPSSQVLCGSGCDR